MPGILAFFSMLINLYLIFLWVPEEKIMGPVQKIFYFHVGTAWVAFLAFFIVFICSILYLRTRDTAWDIRAAASAEIGTVFTGVVLVSGPIWAKAAWNTWWTWEPRLTTSLILFFIYLAYLLVRGSSVDGEKRARLSAVFGIIGFLDVPVVFYSVRWWNVSHPMLIENGRMNLVPEMMLVLMVSVLSFSLLYFYLMQKGMAIARLREQAAEIKGRIRTDME